MIIFDKNLLKTVRTNIVVLPVYEGDDSTTEAIGYIYSDLETFCQAHTLAVRFEGDVTALQKVLALNSSHKEQIDYFTENAPFPFNMLAPFICLCDLTVKIEKDIEDIVEHLHILGRTLAFDKFVAVPAQVRVNVVFNRVTFALRKQEIKQFKASILETSHGRDGEFMYMTDEEVKRVGNFVSLLKESFGGVFGGLGASTSQVDIVEETQVVSSTSDSTLEADTEIDLADDWWKDVQLPTMMTATWKEETTSGISTTETSSEAKSRDFKLEEASEIPSPMDLIGQITAGAINTANLV